MSHAALPADTVERLCGKARLALLQEREKRVDAWLQEKTDEWNYYWLCRVFGLKPKWTPEKVKQYCDDNVCIDTLAYHYRATFADDDLEAIEALAGLASRAMAARLENERCGLVNVTAKDHAILDRWT